MVEHDTNDLEIIQRELKNGSIDYVTEIVQNEVTFENALRNFKPNIILSDYFLPGFSGLAAFEIKEKISPATPFIFVSGTIGEENSIELIKNGVTDYALKDKLFTLNTKINRALKEAREKQEKIKIESELIDSESRLKKAQEIAHMGSWKLDFATGISIWSEESLRIYGISLEENNQTFETWLSFVHPEDLGFVLKKIEGSQLSLKGYSFHHRIIRKNGVIRHLYSEAKFEFDTNGKPTGMYGIAHDVTDLKLTEELLITSDQRYKNLLGNMNDGFIVYDTTGKVIFANKAFLQIFNLTEDDIKNFVIEDYIAPEYHKMLSERHNRRISGEKVPDILEYEGFKKGGERIWLGVRVSPVIENKIIIGTQSVVHDITDRKRAFEEIKVLNATLEEKVKERTAELMESNRELETFNYSASHDLRAPLSVMKGFAEILLKKNANSLDEEGKKYLEFISDNAKRMSHLIDDLLKLSHLNRETLVKTAVNLNEMVAQVLEEVKLSYENISFEVYLSDLKTASGDSGLLKQVWINLISNSVKYSAKKAKPVIEIGLSVREGEAVYYVKDNGAGFDMKNINNLFIPFKRLHSMSEFEGTGVGLSLVHRIITRHGGKIWADAKVDEGATFYFTLPESGMKGESITLPAIQKHQFQGIPQRGDSKQLHILLADDDIDDCNFFSKALQALPISSNLTTVRDGERLMKYLDENSEQLPDVLFLDINMPRKSGFECLSEIKENIKLKDIPVVMFSTSYPQHMTYARDMMSLLSKIGASDCIRKPSDFEQLKQVIHNALIKVTEKGAIN